MIDDRPPKEQGRPGSAGLCDRCRHMQPITSSRGSVFYQCRMSFVDGRFPRYPRIPVIACPAFSPAAASRPPQD